MSSWGPSHGGLNIGPDWASQRHGSYLEGHVILLHLRDVNTLIDVLKRTQLWPICSLSIIPSWGYSLNYGSSFTLCFFVFSTRGTWVGFSPIMTFFSFALSYSNCFPLQPSLVFEFESSLTFPTTIPSKGYKTSQQIVLSYVLWLKLPLPI